MDYEVIEERKLKSAWPVKIEKDCDAFHNIDAEEELTSILAEQINREIKKNIMEVSHTKYAKNKIKDTFYGDILTNKNI